MDSWPKFNLHTKQSPGAVNSCVFFQAIYSRAHQVSQPIKLSVSQSITSYYKQVNCLACYSCVQYRFIYYHFFFHKVRLYHLKVFLWIFISLAQLLHKSAPIQCTACSKLWQVSDFISMTADCFTLYIPCQPLLASHSYDIKVTEEVVKNRFHAWTNS